MGAYGNTPEAALRSPDSDSDGLPDDWELHWLGHLDEDAAGDADQDQILNVTEYYYDWNPDTPSSTLVRNLTKGLNYQTIQSTLCEAADGDEIVVNPGIYLENVAFGGKNVILTGADPFSAEVVRSTVIDGGGRGSCATFSGTERSSCVLAGLTLRNGNSNAGGGILGGTSSIHSHAAIRNNIISGSSARLGGGLAYCDGEISNNLIADNSAAWAGGGLYSCGGVIQNNIVCRNSAEQFGGGLVFCSGVVQNDTITANSADHDAGLEECRGKVLNCIIWDNHSPFQFDGSVKPTYSCIQNWNGVGEGNIEADPRFLDAENGDFRLRADSPCIDAGSNSPDLADTDIAGMHRIMFGGKSLTVDIGAYEFHIWPPTENVQTGEVTLKWSSLADRTYSVYASSDMFTWELLADDVASAGDTVTTWVDPPAPALPLAVQTRYYKIAEKPAVPPFRR